MKNFRKVLALVLVVATLFSFTAMAGAANKYEDASAISYKEAVDVLSYVGVLDGYEVAEDEYEFHPTDKITREEMAKMIAVLCNAGDDVSTLYASACTFADVAKDRWSASYVAYCAKTGIVAGRSASTFDPKANVTGMETAKMLLVALGFDAEVQGYVGADWKLNVLKDVKALGLLNGFAKGYDIEAPITREEAAQMMLNALMNNVVVGYLSDNAKVVVTNKGFKDLDGWEWTLLDAKGTATLYGKVVVSNTPLFTALWGGNMQQGAITRDCYGRPSTTWTWTDAKGNEKVVGKYPIAPVWTSVNTDADEVAEVIDDYDVKDVRNGKENYFVNGTPNAAFTYGPGAEVSIYVWKLDGKFVIDVVVINTFIGKISEVDTYHKTVSIKKDNQTLTADNVYGLTSKNKNAVVLYWVCADGLHNLELATPTAATVTKAVKDNANGGNYFIASGDKYTYSVTFNQTIDLEGKIFGQVYDGKAYGIGGEYNIYTDKNGFVMGYKEITEDTTGYAVVDDSSLKQYPQYNTQEGTEYKYGGKIVEFEAEPAVGDEIAFDESVWAIDVTKNGHDVLLKYYIDADGEFAVDNTWNDNRVYGAVNPTVTLQNNDVVKVHGKYVTDSTQILLRVKNVMNGKYEYKYFDGQSNVDAKYVVNYAQGYFKSASDKLTYLYAEAEYALTSGIAYIMGERTSEVYLTDGSQVVGFNTYKAIVDGEEAVIATKQQLTGGFKKIYDLNMVVIGLTTDGNDPVYVPAVNTSEDVLKEATGATASTLSATDGLLIIEGKARKLDKDAEFVLVFTDGWGDDDFDVMTAAEIAEYTTDWDHAYVWVNDVDGDGDVDVIYVNAKCGNLTHTPADHE